MCKMCKLLLTVKEVNNLFRVPQLFLALPPLIFTKQNLVYKSFDWNAKYGKFIYLFLGFQDVFFADSFFKSKTNAFVTC